MNKAEKQLLIDIKWAVEYRGTHEHPSHKHPEYGGPVICYYCDHIKERLEKAIGN